MILQSLNNNDQIDAIFLDFSKALIDYPIHQTL